ncbi:heme-binding protein 2-like isoform X2 [Palaemon carinicauda]|uniref:heme-binding protein 2-like isoform X2 n=1 Tax=Palaemon carinicauda TaxID=392227 RepID=UPI0035B66BC9
MALMKNLSVILVVLLALALSPVNPASLFSTFASNLGPQEEIKYTVLRRGSGYEERLYPSKNWLCTEQKGINGNEDQIQVFLRLFDYLGGENDQNRKLKMGIPASIEYKVRAEGKVYLACFFLEEKDQSDYPTPTNKDVFITRRPEMTVFTRKFGGYATTESTWMAEADSLRTLLKLAGENTQSDTMYWNAYNSPVKFWNRRNEVWLLKE